MKNKLPEQQIFMYFVNRSKWDKNLFTFIFKNIKFLESLWKNKYAKIINPIFFICICMPNLITDDFIWIYKTKFI
jgi:hypothetical protein